MNHLEAAYHPSCWRKRVCEACVSCHIDELCDGVGEFMLHFNPDLSHANQSDKEYSEEVGSILGGQKEYGREGSIRFVPI
jgi:hypothetical protein